MRVGLIQKEAVEVYATNTPDLISLSAIRGAVRTEGEIIGLAMENVMKTQSGWSVIREDTKAAVVAGIIMENI